MAYTDPPDPLWPDHDVIPCESCGVPLTEPEVAAEHLECAACRERQRDDGEIIPVPAGCTLCDVCDAVSEVYAFWATCRGCSDRLCPDCEVPGSHREDDGAHSALCANCADEPSFFECPHCRGRGYFPTSPDDGIGCRECGETGRVLIAPSELKELPYADELKPWKA